MDTTLLDSVIASGTTMLTELIGALFTFLTSIWPILLGLVGVSVVVSLAVYVFHLMRSAGRGRGR